MKSLIKSAYKLTAMSGILAIALFAFAGSAYAAPVITVNTAKITGAHELTIVFNTSGQSLVAAPAIAYGTANSGVDALILVSDGGVDHRTITDTTLYPNAAFTAVYTFDGAAASANDTGSITINNPTVITAGPDTF